MAKTKSDQRVTYPLPAYNFRVTVDGNAMSFAEVSGMQVEYDTVKYAHGLSYWEGESVKKYYFDKATTVTFKRGTVRGIKFLSDWLAEKTPRVVEVSLCDEAGQPTVTWKINKALALKMDAPTFDATSNEVAVESMEVEARGITVNHH